MFNEGDEIWVDNDVLGYPPTKHVVGLVCGKHIIFRDPGPAIGCKISVAHHSLHDAVAQMIRNDEYHVYIKDDVAYISDAGIPLK